MGDSVPGSGRPGRSSSARGRGSDTLDKLSPYREDCSSASPNVGHRNRSSASPNIGHRNKLSLFLDGDSSASPNVGHRNKLSPFRDGCSSASPNVGHRNRSPQTDGPPQRHSSPERLTSSHRANAQETCLEPSPFDICRTVSHGVVRLQKSILEINREKKREQSVGVHVEHLRPGMILLKSFISYHDQVTIVQTCRELGIGEGGFYRPGYRDGAKLHLQMMCLGKNWDPESRLYDDRRLFDGAIPPKIPDEFKKLVEKGLCDSHDFLKRQKKGSYIEELPWMSPDICIVNFYSNSGKLGLHQDRDESIESRLKGLPVVSFSVGDSAWFSYGDGRDVDKAEKVLLESGDVLIFGGESRLIFHGVDSIEPKTAPRKLVEETKLKPGRLNLTFRQY